MQCPVDQTELTMTERQGVEIDYCSRCRGVWLDRGELDKLIDRSTSMSTGPSYDAPRDRGYGGGHHGGGGHDERGRKRRGWLGDLFD